MKRLSFRFVRRLMLLLALVFPVVYLMGGFVAALAGSHGNVTLAQDDEVVVSQRLGDFNQTATIDSFDIPAVTSKYVVLVDTFSIVQDHVYLLSMYQGSDVTSERNTPNLMSGSTYIYQSTSTDFNPNLGLRYWRFTSSFTSDSARVRFWGAGFSSDCSFSRVMFFDLTRIYGAGNEPSGSQFLLDFPESYYSPVAFKTIVFDEFGTPTYAEFLFNQILGSDNIIKQWGYYALSDEEKGFAPFATLIKIVDDNFFHLGDSNDLGLFVYGYVYYALNIVAIYELVALVVMVFTIPLKLTDRFTKEM